MARSKTTILLWVLTAIVLTTLYTHGALRNARRVNTNMHGFDQSAYMNYARNLAESDYTHVGGRNRMPMYPLLLSFVYSSDLSDEAFFERGKYFNIALSVVLLAALFFIVRAYLPPGGAILLLLITAFTVFIFRAPYVQAELLFYFLNFCLFLLLNKMLLRPTWQWGAVTGIVAGLAHLTKASILPALILFFVVAALKMGYMLARRHITPRQVAPTFLSIASVAILFLVIVFPYISTSKRVFGSYFYNVNSTFYMWYDSWEEVIQGTRAHSDRVGWPDMPPDEIPGPAKYLREHTVQDILVRFLRGFYLIALVAIHSYGYLLYLLIYLVTCLGMLHLNPSHAHTIIKRYPFLWLFNILYFLAYLVLYTWYAQIVFGVRFTLAQFLPALFALSCIIYRLYPETMAAPFGRGKKTISSATLIMGFTSSVGTILGIDICFVLAHRITTMYGGN